MSNSNTHPFFSAEFVKLCKWIGIPASICCITGLCLFLFTYPTGGVEPKGLTIFAGMLFLLGIGVNFTLISIRLEEYFELKKELFKNEKK